MQVPPLHPRPQMTRDRWIDLGGRWHFAFDDADIGLRENWVERAEVFDRVITVPFPPESEASGIADRSPHRVVWYRRDVRIEAADRAGRIVLHFGAVDYRADVWVNGSLVAHHEGGQTPFAADITRLLNDGDAAQQIVVRAEDDPRDLAQPRGKQDWQPVPHRIWYHRTTGIWQPVWLEPVPEEAIARLQWTPDLDRSVLGLEVSLDAPPAGERRLRVRLRLNGVALADETWRVNQAECRHQISLEQMDLVMERDRFLWSPKSPNLIDAEVTLLDGDQAVDTVQSYVGLRSCGVANGRFLLNGRPFYPRLVLAQGYWPDSHLAAPDEAALRQEVSLVKALGFNGVRVHQKVEDPRFLAWCDRLGLVVWGEMANAYVFTPAAMDRLTREWLEVVRRDYSHPCIVTWMPINESWGVPNLARDPAQQAFVRGLYHLTKALDPTRPVLGNDGWELVASDIWGIHDYAAEGETLRARYGTREALERTVLTAVPSQKSIALDPSARADQPVMLTEFGGISHAPAPGDRWFGYGTVTTDTAFLAKYDELVGAVVEAESVAGFCYTQLTDTEQETNGLLTARRVPKLDLRAVRAITERAARSVSGS